MNRLYRVAVLLLLCFFFYQCQKDLSYIGAPDPGVPGVISSDPIKAILQGNILDETGQPAAGVSITVGTKTVMTNGSGYFRITDASLDKNTSLVTAQKEGYFKGYRVFAATSGTNQVVIKLIKKNLAGTLTASSGGSATLSNGAKISLPANSVVLASAGSVYTGDINVYAAYIDPRASDIAETVPGSYAANDKNGKRVILSSYGMLAVELESVAGEKLQIKSGVAATLTTPIPSSSLSSAPATIVLWYVDEQTGVWKEEGTATKQGNNYVGDVKHFSYWNCDYPYDAVSLSLTLQNDKSLPLVNVQVEVSLSDTGSGSHAYGYTDSLGQVKGFVPSDKNLLLEVLDPCGKTVYSQNLSALNKNTDLGTITVTNATTSLLTFTGTLLNCSTLPVKNGYAIINFNNFIRYATTDNAGKFTTTFITCSGTPATALVFGIDETSQQQSATSTLTVTAPVTDAGNITACGTSSAEYIKYTLDDTVHNITTGAPTDTITYRTGSSETYIYGHRNNDFNDYINFTVQKNVSAPGTFPVATLEVGSYNPNVSFSNLITIIQPFNVTFTRFANNVGEFSEGSFLGKFTTYGASTIHTISCTFKVRRNN